jgi:hypothetical protein
MDDSEIQKGILHLQELAVYVVDKFGPLSEIEFGLNRDSVEWIEGFIERARKRRESEEGVPQGLVNTLGAFLGESIMSVTGGCWHWQETQKDWGILFPSGAMAFPFTKVWRQFESGVQGGDSIVSFYDVAVNYVAAGKLSEKH